MTFVIGDPPLPPPTRYTYVSLSLKKSFFVHLVYVSFSLYYPNIDICYFIHASSEPMVLEEHQIQVVGDPPLPPRYMYVSLSLKTSFSVHVVYVSFYLYLLTLAYVTLSRHLVSQWCLKSTKSMFWVTHLSPPHVHVCFVFFENIIFHPCSIYVSFYFYYLTLTYVNLYRLLVSQWCLKSTKSKLRLSHF